VILGAALAAAATSVAVASGALFELAADGRWDRVLEVALRREAQLPLSEDEAHLAAHASRMVGDTSLESRFLVAAMADDTELGQFSRVRLANLIVADEPGRAVDLVLGSFDRRTPWPLRELSTTVAVDAVQRGLDAERTASLEGAAPRLTRSLERRVELSLAMADRGARRERLVRLLKGSTRDLVALSAAETLSGLGDLSAVERWRIAETWYRHAMYQRAAPLLEGLAASDDDDIPRDRVCFYRGRCAFRLGRWEEAVGWYRRSVALAVRGDQRAAYEVHLGRAYELDGDLDGASAAAVRAVRLKTTDERRLFLARLRLRQQQPDLARQGISRLRSRTNRSRGAMMLAVDALARGDGDAAAADLAMVRGRTWSGPAAVFTASLLRGTGEGAEAVAVLDKAAVQLDSFWIGQARAVMASIPAADVGAWRRHRESDVAGTEERARWRAYGRWGALEPDAAIRSELARKIDEEFFAAAERAVPVFPPGLAAELWRLGLQGEAARWDPSGFPSESAIASAWSAARFREFGLPWRATRVADTAWRQVGSEVPTDMLPASLRRSLYPLPISKLVLEAAETSGVDWWLLAAVAREESRWDNRAVSVVGARGLLQLMPATAEAVAERERRTRPTPDDLFDPRVNLGLGAAELARLTAAFGGRRAPAVAAYNAGEAQARLWLDQCGPGCSDGLYLVNISFTATRTYVAHVLSSADRYRELYGSAERSPR
jgi:soluble lytic murein transglycosylase